MTAVKPPGRGKGDLSDRSARHLNDTVAKLECHERARQSTAMVVRVQPTTPTHTACKVWTALKVTVVCTVRVGEVLLTKELLLHVCDDGCDVGGSVDTSAGHTSH